MQPVSPIPHLSPSLTVRGPRRAAEPRAFQADLARAMARRQQQTVHQRGPAAAATARPATRTRELPPSVMLLQRPQIHRPAAVVARLPGAAAETGNPDESQAALRAKIHAVSRRLGVDPLLSEAIARAESNLDPTARSPDGKSEGAFQMKRPTIAEMRRRLSGDPAGLPLSDEVTLAVGYLRYLDGLFAKPAVLDAEGRRTTPIENASERRRFAIAAYNAGEGRVATAQRQARAAGADPRRFDDVRPFLPPVTQRYVGRVLEYTGGDSF